MNFEPKEFKGRRACVIGLGRSGVSCSRLLLRKGFKVFGSDSKPRREIEKTLGRMPAGFAWEWGGHSKRVLNCGFAVKSPGISPSLKVFEKFKEAGIAVFSELEVAMAFCRSHEIVVISGTNGKTTTTALAGEIFKTAARRHSRRVLICGNIGLPVSEVAPKARARDILILEVSSYQLADSSYFHPRAAALLNITADHLDYHGSMARYIESKARIFRDQGKEDVCIFNATDPLTLKLSRSCPSRRLFFAPAQDTQVQAWLSGGRIKARLPGTRKITFVPPQLPGEHNLENAMAAILLALSLGLKANDIQRALKGFRGVEHRLEEVGTFRGLLCINDSKATNVDSTLVALKALEGAENRILLILGGLHKGSPYAPLVSLIKKMSKESSPSALLPVRSRKTWAALSPSSPARA
jgi:UDP-N-acetylmuramoylalanine--D-glutamate ligase